MASATEIYRDVADQELLDRIEGFLAKKLAQVPFMAQLQEAVSYALLGSGKRVRPVLAVRACEAAGGHGDDALAAGVAIEMIHCFSLVHDDLPAIDDDNLRRGQPTLHKKMGEDIAILAGDALHTFALETASSSATSPLRIVEEILHGTRRMIEGQVLDTAGGFPESMDALSRVRLMHELKTASLITSACRCGAIAADAPSETYAALDRYGHSLGLMFQVVDDLIDATQTTEHLGKTAGKDLAIGKLTFPAVIGIPRSQEEVIRLEQEALAALDALGPSADSLRSLARNLAVRTK
jgi:geranylgeranyl pyrophosphate synthase